MPGTKAGTKKRLATTKDKYGDNVFRKYGAKGGKSPTKKPKGFAWMKEHQPDRFAEITKQHKKGLDNA